MRSTTIKHSINALVLLCIMACSLFLGISMQNLTLRFAVLAFGVGFIWILGAIGPGMSLIRTLVLLSTFFIKPFELFFYFALATLIFCLIVDYYKNPRAKLRVPYPIAFLTLLVFGFIALSKTKVAFGVTYFAASVLVPFIVFMVITNIRASKRDLDIWMRAIVVIAIFLSIYGVIIALLNPGDRIGSTWTNAMTINGLYAVAFFFSIGLGINTSKPVERTIWLAGAILIFLGMLFTYTRIAMVAVVFGMLLLMLKVKSVRKWGLIGVGLIPLIIPTAMTQRGSIGSMLDLSILIRLVAWYNAVGVIAQNPLTGIGFSTWSKMYSGMIPVPFLYAQHAHNIILNLFLDMGIIGSLAYFAIIIKTIGAYWRKVVKKSNDYVHFAVFVALLSLLVSCLTDIFIQQYSISLLFWITLALVYNQTKGFSPDQPQIN